MAHSTIDRYITNHYEDWQRYTRRQCSWRGLHGQADEVLSDAVLVLLEKDEQTVIEMIRKEKIGCTWLDTFMYVTIQYKCLIRKCKRSIDRRTVTGWELEWFNIPEPEDDCSEEYDICGKMNIIRELLPRLDVPEINKRTFEFIVFQGYSSMEWPGSDSAARCRIRRTKIALQQAISAGNY